MPTIIDRLSQELSLTSKQIEAALELYREGATIPFIARYRKERTGEMNEIDLRNLFERFDYLSELDARKEAVLKSIEEQGKLTDVLKAKIQACTQKNELEDLYLPFKPKKRTRATLAKEKGLEPLAEFINRLNQPDAVQQSATTLIDEAAKFISDEKGVKSVQDALQGASDILAEAFAEKADYRALVRDFIMQHGVFVSKIKDEFPEGTTKFETYRNFRASVKTIEPHQMLALRRGEAEGVVVFDVEFDEAEIVRRLEKKEIHTPIAEVRAFLKEMIQDAFERLLKTAMIGETRYEKKVYADEESIKTFEANLRNLLLASPAGMKPTLGIDPGFRTGCKVAVVDGTGKFLEYKTIFPHQSDREKLEAAATLIRFIETHRIELIAIGNGTAGRETETFVRAVVKEMNPVLPKPIVVMVSEAGASVYSASEVAIEEFPDLDLTVRGAISIARRLQDPLSELVKIDPKSIGVGQYQHDVDQRRLKKKLEETVESAVNFVGVDLNTASAELLKYVSGLTPSTAKSIVKYRNERGAFKQRAELLNVPKFGAKTFEQAAGFLRIRDGENPLDNTAVHPERYPIVQRIADDLQLPVEHLSKRPEQIKSIDLARYINGDVGEPTLRDILIELQKPGRDPRAEFKYASFKDGVTDLKDLKVGMMLEGVVTNVANFGAFVDIGVHQDGLVHLSQLADRFVKDPNEVVKVGQIVSVRVLEVNETLRRISLTMRKEEARQTPANKPQSNKTQSQKAKRENAETRFSIDDLKAKFNRK
ncbi:MAG: Tex family protein [Chloroherpetonaceae bacterium]